MESTLPIFLNLYQKLTKKLFFFVFLSGACRRSQLPITFGFNALRRVSTQPRQLYGKDIKVFSVEIPLSVRAAETTAVARSIYNYDPNGKAADAYMTLTKEVLKDER